MAHHRRLFPLAASMLLALPALATTTVLQDNTTWSGTSDARIVCCDNTNEGGLEVISLIPQDTTAALFKFNIFTSQGGQVPDGATIQSATLSVYRNYGPAAVFEVHRVNRAWSEAAVSWTDTGSSGGWSGAMPPDVDSAAESTVSMPDGSTCPADDPGRDDCWANFDVTASVAAYAGGAANNGWKLLTNDPSHTPKDFYSSENTRATTLRPKLTVTWTQSDPQPNLVPLYVAYRASNTDYLYTTDVNEKNNAVAQLGFADQGIAGYCNDAPSTGTVPLYRFWKGAPQNEHFYTTDENDRTIVLTQDGYTQEGNAACWVWPSATNGAVAFYRMSKYDGATGDLVHFYTTDWNAVTQKQGEGYTYERVDGYIQPAQASGGSWHQLQTDGRAVATFHSVSLYWNPPAGTAIGPRSEIPVRYRKLSDDPNNPASWKDAHPIWYDPDGSHTPSGVERARGSVVHLDPGTAYSFEFGGGPADYPWTRTVTATTWSESFTGTAGATWTGDHSTMQPAGEYGGGSIFAVLYIQQSDSGSAGNYKVYDFANNASATAPQSIRNYGVVIDASYVVLKNFKVAGGSSGIYIRDGSHDVIIDNVEVTDYGSTPGNDEGGVQIADDKAYGGASRIVIQNCRFHNPHLGSITWDTGHPDGAAAISMFPTAGQIVVRNNAVWSTMSGAMDDMNPDLDHFHQDGLVMGGRNDIGLGPDIDIYRNIVMDYWDDGVETDGSGINNRVWDNYFDYGGASAVSTTSVLAGPAYVWRNVYNRQRMYRTTKVWGDDLYSDARSYAMKAGGNGGRRYIYNNTTLQMLATDDPSRTSVNGNAPHLGAGYGMGGTGEGDTANTVTRNNVFEMFRSDSGHGVFAQIGSGNDFDHDITNGAMSEPNGFQLTTIRYQAGNGPNDLWHGHYLIESITNPDGSQVPNVSQPISNFNPLAGAPYGAQETADPMRWGPGAGGN